MRRLIIIQTESLPSEPFLVRLYVTAAGQWPTNIVSRQIIDRNPTCIVMIVEHFSTSYHIYTFMIELVTYRVIPVSSPGSYCRNCVSFYLIVCFYFIMELHNYWITQ